MPRAKALASTDGGATEAGQYHVILADPPWEYKQRVAKIRKHYSLMPQEAISALPVGALAAPDCALFLWATMPTLPDAFAVMQAWGFTYKSVAFTWVKLNADGSPFLGLGSVTRSNAELCLFGYRGRPKVNHNHMSSVLMTRRRQHSRKPDEVYDRIMALFDGPFIELFARQQWPGWETAYSNQSGKFLAQPFLFKEAM